MKLLDSNISLDFRTEGSHSYNVDIDHLNLSIEFSEFSKLLNGNYFNPSACDGMEIYRTQSGNSAGQLVTQNLIVKNDTTYQMEIPVLTTTKMPYCGIEDIRPFKFQGKQKLIHFPLIVVNEKIGIGICS